MPKQMIEVEVPEGWEAVAYRVPMAGEYILRSVTVGRCDFDHTARLIVRPVWKWPEWLKASWIAMDKSGLWFAFSDEPHAEGRYWMTGTGSDCCSTNLSGGLVDFTPPPCDDWRKSKRRNPHLDAKE